MIIAKYVEPTSLNNPIAANCPKLIAICARGFMESFSKK